jgi:hypothetical protein
MPKPARSKGVSILDLGFGIWDLGFGIGQQAKFKSAIPNPNAYSNSVRVSAFGDAANFWSRA